jgi:hypothetical protein
MAHIKTKSDNDDSHARSAQHEKAEEIQAAGTAKQMGDVPEGGPAPAPKMAKGHPMPATSRADDDGTTEAGTSPATAGREEKEHARLDGALKEQHGRGHRKSEHDA